MCSKKGLGKQYPSQPLSDSSEGCSAVLQHVPAVENGIRSGHVRTGVAKGGSEADVRQVASD